MYNDKSIIIDNFIELIDKNIYFCNIYLFIERIKNMTTTKNIKIIKNKSYIYFRDIALT